MDSRPSARSLLRSVRLDKRRRRAAAWCRRWWPAIAFGVPIGIGAGLVAVDPAPAMRLFDRVLGAVTASSGPTEQETSPSGLQADEGHVVGRASVVDGDTIEIHGRRIRLYGIDAPEAGQTCRDVAGSEYRCGQRAARFLDQVVGAATISCHGDDHDRYGRLVARCSVAGEDIAETMVSAGWAVAFTRYSADYVSAESGARQRHVGLWAGDFDPPWEWRQAHQPSQ